ncbi:MAG: glycosyltransferase [Salinivirgaceae bacterium]|jgi:glycosyltransferase involved in cell wall biosynthesis|nr:glycosyltransferase [Salinivirgaceae bacterium]
MNLFAWFWSFVVVIGVLYTALIVWFLNGWKSIPQFTSSKQKFSTKVTVVVPFYNEQPTLKKCIEALLKQNIQTLEYQILLIDDQSDDSSTEIAKGFAEQYHRVSYFVTEQKGKKHAILLGVKNALGELIVTTDADCTYNKNWLSTIVDYYESYESNIIVGPVMFQDGKSLLQKFQQIEFTSLVASGAGAIGIGHAIMCNGANLAFKKEVFDEFDDPLNLKYNSGDDVFLLHNMKTIDNDKIHFLKSEDAVVRTRAVKDLRTFFKQRFRWTSKAPGYKDNDTQFTAFVVFAASLLWVSGLASLTYNSDFWKPVLFLFVLKTIVDIVFLNQISDFFNIKRMVKWMPLFQLFYGFYVVIAGLSVFFKKRL